MSSYALNLNCLLLFAMATQTAFSADSVCYGSTSQGRLENGVQLPSHGKNFTSYGTLPELDRRTYVHSLVRDIIIHAYQQLETDHPEKVFKYAETGFQNGGTFKPHKTHQNGLSVDFMVPVINEAGRSVHLPTNPLNKYGYGIEFDQQGRFGDYRIDFEAMAAHIKSLHLAAKSRKAGIWRVIFDPPLVPNLYKTRYGTYLRENILIPDKPSWVRHDEHYHVDFDIACKSL